MIKIISLGFSLIFLASNISAAKITPQNFLEELKNHNGRVTSMEADLYYIISGYGKQKIKQKGKYYYKSPDKVRLEIQKPITQTMIIKNSVLYLKPYGATRFVKNENGDISAKIMTSDLFQYDYLKQYNYELNEGKSNRDEGKYCFEGFEQINNEIPSYSPLFQRGVGGDYKAVGEDVHSTKIKRLELIFDNNIGVVESYKIIGNPIAPAIEVTQRFKEINGIIVPYKTLTKVRLQMGEVTSLIVLKNIKVNLEISDGIFSTGN